MPNEVHVGVEGQALAACRLLLSWWYDQTAIRLGEPPVVPGATYHVCEPIEPVFVRAARNALIAAGEIEE